MTLLSDRHLIEVDLRSVPSYRFDVVIVGGGVAGDAAALSAASEGKSVAVVTKSSLSNSNTNMAQGGMAAVMTTVRAEARRLNRCWSWAMRYRSSTYGD